MQSLCVSDNNSVAGSCVSYPVNPIIEICNRWLNGECSSAVSESQSRVCPIVKTVLIDSKTKEFDIEVGTPPASSLIFKELGVEKGSGSAGTHKIGNLTIDQAIKIAKMKHDNLLGKELKQKTKEIIGTCVSLGVTVEGKKPAEIQKAIDENEYDSKF